MHFLRENGWPLYPLWHQIREGVGATGDWAEDGGGNLPTNSSRRKRNRSLSDDESEGDFSDDSIDDDLGGTERTRNTPTPSKRSTHSSQSGSVRSKARTKGGKRKRDARSDDDAVSEISRSYLEGVQEAGKRVTIESVRYLKEDLAEMSIDDAQKRRLRLHLARNRDLTQSYIDQPKEDRQELLLALLDEMETR